MLLTPTAKKLTSEYTDNTLKDGNYYVSISNGKPQVATYRQPSAAERAYRSNNNLPQPQPKLICEGVLMLGALKTVTILARVPDYQDLTEEQKDELKG